MRINYLPVLSFLLLTSAVRTVAQPGEPVTDSLSSLVSKYRQTNSDKNIVLLTSRNIYMAGEKIWFNAYNVIASTGRPDLISQNLFADIVNEKDSIIQQLVLDNTGQHTHGAFDLPASLPTGFYWIRCYTARLLENHSNDIFLHPVYVVNKQLHDESSYTRKFENNLARNNLSPFIHFYAERLTANPGIISTGVIEIRDGYNNPLQVKGDLLNSKDSMITSFNTNRFGLARLTFVNEPAERYTAVFYLDNRTARYQLPLANKNSIQFSVANQTAKTIKAFVTLEDGVGPDSHTTILAMQRDSLYWAAVGTGNYGVTIPIADFRGGIVRLLLFNGNKDLVSERKIYIPKENVDLEIKPDKRKYSGRENVSVRVKARGSSGEQLACVLNVSVEDERIEQFSDSMEANSFPPAGDFALENWLNRHHTKYSDDDIDLLMATRRSTLQQAFDTSSSQAMTDYDDNKKLRNLIGQVVNRKGNGIDDRIVSAMAKNSRQFFIDVDTTDKDGRFSLSIPQDFDSLQLTLQITNKHLVQMTSDSIKIEDFHYPDFSTPLSLKQQFLSDNFNTLALLRRHRADTASFFPGMGWLTPVTVKAIKKAEPNYDVSRRINSISQILTNDKIKYAVNADDIKNALMMVPGVSWYYGDFSIFGPTVSLNGKVVRPMVIIDGTPMPPNTGVMDAISNLNPADIDFIEVLRGGEAAQFGWQAAGGGVFSINTKHGPGKTYNNNNFHVFTPVTYHVSPNFEMPDYSNKEIKNSSAPDPRTTIYWNAGIVTDTNGEAVINFYTADAVTNYTITITGLTEKGDLVYKRVVIGNKGKSR